MKIIGALIISACLFACQERTKVTGQQEVTDTLAGNIPIAQKVCYSYINGKDTAQLTLITTGIASTGELSYKWFEKDKNNGTIAGEMRGDTLIADYTFNAEGKQSVREVVFLKKENQLIEGFGEVEEKEDKTRFKDLAKIQFNHSIIFKKVTCN